MKFCLHIVWLQSRKYVSGKNLVPRSLKDNYTKWISFNKNDHDITLKTYSEEDVVSYITKHFDKTILKAYQRMNIPHAERFRCDLFRLLALYVEGGVYVDIDQVPIMSLKDMGLTDDIDFMSNACSFDNPSERRFSNAFIYVKSPRSKFVMLCIQNLVKKFLTTPRYLLTNSNHVSGTYIMGDTYRSMFPNKSLESGISNHNGELWILLNSVMGKRKEKCKNNIEFWCSFHVENLQGDIIMLDRYPDYYKDRVTRDPKKLVNFI